MFRPFSRSAATLFVAVLMTAVNGGVLAFASNWDGSTPAPDASQIAAEIIVLAGEADQLNSCCGDLDEAPQARQSSPICKAGSSDCGGPLPIASAVSGGSADPWAMHAFAAHRDYLGEHQLRPPRI